MNNCLKNRKTSYLNKVVRKIRNYKRLLVLENELEASLMSDLLNEREIPHNIQSNHSIAYDGIFQFTGGWGYLEADPVYKEEIVEIYKEFVQLDN